MNRTKKLLAAIGAVAALGAGGAAIAGAVSGGGDERDQGATGPGAAQAREAALAITGGHANAVERDGENGATWEVEVRKPDGSTVDVRLGASYERVAIDSDSESHDDGS